MAEDEREMRGVSVARVLRDELLAKETELLSLFDADCTLEEMAKRLLWGHTLSVAINAVRAALDETVGPEKRREKLAAHKDKGRAIARDGAQMTRESALKIVINRGQVPVEEWSGRLARLLRNPKYQHTGGRIGQPNVAKLTQALGKSKGSIRSALYRMKKANDSGE